MLTLFKYDNQVVISRQLASVLIMLCAFLVLLGTHLIQIPILEGFAVIAAVFASVAAIGLCVVSLLVNFYGSMAGNQSYLTYTIPYKTPAILFTKICVSVLWFLGCIGTVLLVWWSYCSMKEIDFFLFAPGFKEVFSFIALPVVGQFLFMICLLVLCVSLSVLPVFRNQGAGILAAIIAYPVLSTLGGLVVVVGMVAAAFLNGTGNVIFSNSVSDAEILQAIDSIKYVIFGLYTSLSAVYLLIAIRIFDKHRAI